MKILVVDDEPLAQQRLKLLISDLEAVTSVETASNGLQAIEVCQTSKPDVVLMDIRMPAMDGLEAADHISHMEDAPAIIFTTAYDEYALAAFNVNAIDYLLKPVRRNKLEEAILKASCLNQAQLSAIKLKGEPGRTHISTNFSGNIKLIPLKDVIYFQADQKYITVKHIKGETIIEDTLKELQVEFAETFIRVHRNALVSKSFVSGLYRDGEGHSFVTLKDLGDKLEISRRHLSEVKKLLKSL
ncbi:MAG: two-component system response regulator AlgR [Polaribacter sp.]|jgi:two-component system response regulator AlgR